MNINDYNLPPNTVLVLKSVNPDMTAFGGFIWPKLGHVKAPDWSPEHKCGAGLHGWLWGVGDFSLAVQKQNAKWLVIEVAEDTLINLGGKVKFEQGNVIYCGDFQSAFKYVRITWGLKYPITSTSCHYSHSSTTGDSSHSSTSCYYSRSSTTGDSSHSSTTGDSSHSSTTGIYSHSSTSGHYSHSSTTGNYSHSSTTGNYSRSSTTGSDSHSSTTGIDSHSSTTGIDSHSSTTGKNSIACCLGGGSRAKAGVNGSLILTYYDGFRTRHVIGYVGENNIEANVWYEASDGILVKCEDQD
jgi:hypothetical protein